MTFLFVLLWALIGTAALGAQLLFSHKEIKVQDLRWVPLASLTGPLFAMFCLFLLWDDWTQHNENVLFSLKKEKDFK